MCIRDSTLTPSLTHSLFHYTYTLALAHTRTHAHTHKHTFSSSKGAAYPTDAEKAEEDGTVREAVYASCFASVQRIAGDMEQMVAENTAELKASVSFL